MASLHRRDPHILHVVEVSDVSTSCPELGSVAALERTHNVNCYMQWKELYSFFMHTSWWHIKLIHCKGLQKQRPADLTVHDTRLTATIANCENAAHLLHAGVHAQNHELDQFQKCNCKREVVLTNLISKHTTSSTWHVPTHPLFSYTIQLWKKTKELYTLDTSIIITLTTHHSFFNTNWSIDF
jgi:hypothetical protein